jgi:hypothetical protein
MTRTAAASSDASVIMSEPNVIPLHVRKDPSAYRPQPDRGDDRDFWPTTDTDLIRLLVYHVLPKLPAGIIWEAAAGGGHLVDPTRQVGREVVATDLFPNRSDIERHDFLHGPLPPEVLGAIMMTNPPYTLLTEFLVRGLTLIDMGHLAGLVLLTRQGADTTNGRAAAFNRAAYEWRTCWRPMVETPQKG